MNKLEAAQKISETITRNREILNALGFAYLSAAAYYNTEKRGMEKSVKFIERSGELAKELQNNSEKINYLSKFL